MINYSKKHFKIFITILMFVLFFVAIIIYSRNREKEFKQKLQFNDSSYYNINLITEELALILDTDVSDLIFINVNKLEINENLMIKNFSINFYNNKDKVEYKVKFSNNSYYVSYFDINKEKDQYKISLEELLKSIKQIDLNGEISKIIIERQLINKIKYNSSQKQYRIDKNGVYLLTKEEEGSFIRIRQISFNNDQWEANDGVNFFLNINKT